LSTNDTNRSSLPTPAGPVSLCQLDGLTCLRVDHPRATALIALQGAQVLSYTPAGARPVIWLSESAAFAAGTAVRGGVPVCWPWFGDVRRNPDTVQKSLGQATALHSASPAEYPAHGWARDQLWLLEKLHCDDQDVTLSLRLPRSLPLASAWPMEVDLELVLLIGDQLTLQLTTRNRSNAPIAFSQALHSYFSVSHINDVIVHGLEHCPYLDTLDEWQQKADSKPLLIGQETDRIYEGNLQTLSIEDPTWNRRIHLLSTGSRSAVVWNPWIEKAKRLSQFDDSAYQRMLCIETANVMKDYVQLDSGESHTLTVTITCD